MGMWDVISDWLMREDEGDELTCWRLAGVELKGRPDVHARGFKLAERMDGKGGVELQGGWRGKGG
jgi:hypothetical protein